MANPFVHVELMSTDVDKAKSFYGKLFDWTLEDAAGLIDQQGNYYSSRGYVALHCTPRGSGWKSAGRFSSAWAAAGAARQASNSNTGRRRVMVATSVRGRVSGTGRTGEFPHY